MCRTAIGLISRREVGEIAISEFDQSPGISLAPHRHERLSAFVILKGEYAEFTSFSLAPCDPSAVVLKPDGCTHADFAGPHGFRGLLIEVRNETSEAPPIDLPVRIRDQAIRLKAIELRRALAMARNEAAAETASHLAVLIREAAARVANCPPWLNALEAHIYRGSHRKLAPGNLAQWANVSASTLQRTFWRHRGMNVCEFVRNVRLRVAARLLQQSGMSIAQVAAEAGFCDQSHLHKNFSGVVGRTPHHFRKTAALDLDW